MIIAVDGPAAAGKGTIARALAQHFGYHHLDTGTLYRRVGLELLKSEGDIHDGTVATAIAENLHSYAWLDYELRTEAVGAAASIVASIPEVRAALLDFQRSFAGQKPGAVLDGRDIGTVVCPAAQVKLFITASPEVRAQRRQAEMQTSGADVTFEAVLQDIRQRDERDKNRAVAPLVPAKDAVVIDTSEMTAEEAISAAVGAASSGR
ncbi:MAG: (d)CMP kinase [Aestuariivirga sp.]